jgi:hypothetical protein
VPKGPTFEVKAVRREFGPANECIYCHRTVAEVGLTDEHIIPEGLGGRMVLLGASCPNCAQETHAFEGHVMGRLFGDTRRHFGIRGKKRKRSDNPTVYVDRGKGVQPELVRLDAHPAVLVLPIFPPPGLLVGFSKSEGFSGQIRLINFMGDLNKRLRALGGEVNFTRGFDMEPFGRMLCKIAHAYAMAVAPGEFEPFLEDVILGKRPFFLSHLVGTSIIEEPPGNITNTLHQIGLAFQPDPDNGKRLGEPIVYVVVQIRLFAIVDGPLYWVVVGKLKEGQKSARLNATRGEDKVGY